MPFSGTKILEGLGLDPESFNRVKLGQGVVGKSSYVVGVLAVVLLAVAFRADDIRIQASVLASAVLLGLGYLGAVFWFSSKNPGAALLEGAELIQWQQNEMGAKGAITLPKAPNTEPPKMIGGERL